jgi:hypothetical protein
LIATDSERFRSVDHVKGAKRRLWRSKTLDMINRPEEGQPLRSMPSRDHVNASSVQAFVVQTFAAP